MSIKFSSFVALFASMAIAAPAIWDGTADVSWYKSDAQKFTLMTAEELAGVAKLVNEGTTDFSGQTIALGADIFLNDTAGAGAGTWASIPRTSWTPIGTSAKPFKGEFDGIAGKKNRKIYGLYINDTTQNYVGLFGYTSNVKISNLDVLVGRVTAKNNVGALIGCAVGGSVSGVHSEIKVTGVNHVGGLVGYSTGTISTSSVKDNVVGQDSVGGLVGVATSSISGTTKSNSFFMGSVTGRNYIGGIAGAGSSVSKSFVDGSVKGSSYVGGVAGNVTGAIESSYHIGGDVDGTGYVGGLIGQASSSVKNSYSEGNVTGTGNYVGGLIGSGVSIDSSNHVKGDVNGIGYVGGLIGQASSSVKNSYSEGNVTGTGNYVGGLIGSGVSIDSSNHVKGDVNGMGYVGGLIGRASSSVKNSYSEGNVTGRDNYVGGLVGYGASVDSSNHVKGDVSGYGYVGGLIGQASSAVKNSYSEGNVTGTENYVGGVVGYGASVDSSNHVKGDVSGYGYVGGLIGRTSSAVKDSYSEGNVTGKGNYVGGLIGLSYYYYSGSSSMTIMTAQNSYAAGNVNGKGYVGGLIGLDSIYRYSNNSMSLVKKISHSHSVGKVVGKDKCVGGVLGKSSYGYRSSSYSSNISLQILSSYHKGFVESDSSSVGGVAGYASGNIDSAYHIGGDVSGYGYVGGLVGSTSSMVKNSYTEGNVTGTSNYVGGLAGIGSLVDSSSHTNGDVSGFGNNVGGLVGSTSSMVKNSYSKGNVTGTGIYVGGLVGSGSAVINSYSEGNVTGQGNYVGGLIGHGTSIDSSSHAKGEVNGRNYVGGLAGQTTSSVKNSYSEGDVTGQGNYVGGLIGLSFYYYSGSSDITIMTAQNSYASGNVKGKGYVGGLIGLDTIYRYSNNTRTLVKKISNSHSVGKVVGKDKYVGGVLGKSNYGYNSSSYSSNISLQILSSYHKGFVECDSSYVGGVAGYASGIIDSIYHIDGSVSGYGYVGGLVGQATSSVKNSYSAGDVLGSLDYVGGVAGSIGGEVHNSHAEAKFVKGRNLVGGLAGYVGGSIDVSYHEGDSVSGNFEIGGFVGCAKSFVDSSYSTTNVKGDDNVGGLIGSAYGNVSNSYALGNVDGVGEGAGAGHDNLGGLVGYQYSGSISKSMALGNVSGTTNLGGLVGRFDGGKVSQSYANGNVTGSYYGDPADEIGNYYIGGLVGYAKGALEETYASGVVKGVVDEPVYTGCVVGYVNGSLSVTKSYYDETKCDLGIDGGEEAAAVSGSPNKTTTEMQTQETYEDWDFVDTWKILEGTYPFLQIYSNSLTNAVVTTASLEGIVYDGTAKTPLVTSVALFGEILEYETEYTITYKDNVNAGTATINVCGVKPYGGCKVVEFEIAGIAIKPTIAAIEDVTYTGRAQTPEIEVYNGETLLAATDYAVEYMDNVNAGTATVTVTMKGNYSGSASKTFTIEKATPVISQNPTASDIVLGQNLAASELSGGRANVDGEFVWEKSTIKPELENDGYAVVFVPTDTNYTKSAEIIVPVKVLDLVYVAVHAGDNTIDSTALVKGGSYTLPNVPDSIGYDFVGLYKGKTLVGKSGDQIDISENTVIEAIYKIQTFVITFMNGSTVLQSDAVDYGTIPDAPIVTLPENTAQYTYSFVGWDKDIVAATEVTVYTAVIDSVVNKYEVVFKDYDGSMLKDSIYEYGTTAAKIVKPANPTCEASAQYAYTFKSWNPTIADVTEDAVYTATFDSTINTYLISFVNKYDTLQSVKTEMEYGAIPAYEGTPTRKSTAQYVYTFKEWTPKVVAVSEAATYTAVFDSVVQSYTVTFVNGSEELQSDEIAYGVLPEFAGATPTKKATAQYTYTFKGWTPAITKVTGMATYKAVFDSVVNRYLITFKNGSTTIRSDSIAYGILPTVPSITLPKNTAQYTYSMSWDKTVVKVTGDAVYTAMIDSTMNKYEISFKNYDGTLIKDSTYAYGSTVVKPAEPTRTATAKYTFTFKGWTPTVASVTADAVYKAVFDSTIRNYTVVFVNGSDTLQSSNINYGVTPSYKGGTPTKQSTAQYEYTFKGWSPSIAYVSKNATYRAVFDSTLRKYTVSFMSENKKVQTSDVAYGKTPVYSGSTPTKMANDSCTYKFSGWNPKIQPVTDDIVYSAEFSVEKKKFLVRFMVGNSTQEIQSVAYGDIPEYKGETPTKKSTILYSYEFVGWTPKIGRITKETNYEAVFDSTKLTGIMDNQFANLEMSVNVISRNIQVSAAPIGSAYAILDMQGRVLKNGRVESVNFNIAIQQAGNYLVRIGGKTQVVNVK